MMKTCRLLWIALAVVFIANSCYKEDALEPSPSENAGGRFEFPQGDHDYDMRLKAIDEKFGVKVVYKDFTNVDFNLSWTTAAVGLTGYDVSAAEQGDAANFIADHFFAFLTPEVAKGVLKPYFYLADSVGTYTRMELGTNVVEGVLATSYAYTGIDYWMFTWNGTYTWTKVNGTYTAQPKAVSKPNNPFTRFYRRGVMLKEVLKMAVNRGNIVPPPDFSAGLDFTTAISSSVSNANYYKKRGFPGKMNNQSTFDFSTFSTINLTNPTLNFIDYIHLCMRYEPDSIEVNYPRAQYPIIHEKYPVCIQYMKDKYGIDLARIAEKPEM